MTSRLPSPFRFATAAHPPVTGLRPPAGGGGRIAPSENLPVPSLRKTRPPVPFQPIATKSRRVLAELVRPEEAVASPAAAPRRRAAQGEQRPHPGAAPGPRRAAAVPPRHPAAGEDAMADAVRDRRPRKRGPRPQ